MNANTTPALVSATELAVAFKTYLAKAGYDKLQPESLYQPIGYAMASGGKRVRPILCLLAYQLGSKNIDDNILSLALAIEEFHTFTLVHDDIMDQAETRRGLSAVHLRWDVPTAILSGDALFAIAFQRVASSFPEKAYLLAPKFASFALEVCEGQALDMAFALQETVATQDYIRMVAQKTGVLMGASLAMGAWAGGLSLPEGEALYEYGKAIGIAFQIQDDFLDLFGATAETGKRIGGDILEGKHTYLRTLASELADKKQLQVLKDIYQPKNDLPAEAKIAQAKQLFMELGLEARVEADVNAQFEKALRALDTLAGRPGLSQIMELANQLNTRKQ